MGFRSPTKGSTESDHTPIDRCEVTATSRPSRDGIGLIGDHAAVCASHGTFCPGRVGVSIGRAAIGSVRPGLRFDEHGVDQPFPVTVVVGAQWGDEGKAKVIDLLAAEHSHVVRYQGGHNAGHTVVVGTERYALQLIPSGVLYPHIIPVIGNGVVVDLPTLFKEIDTLESRGISCAKLKVSSQAHLIFPWHQSLDALYEAKRGDERSAELHVGVAPRGARELCAGGGFVKAAGLAQIDRAGLCVEDCAGNGDAVAVAYLAPARIAGLVQLAGSVLPQGALGWVLDNEEDALGLEARFLGFDMTHVLDNAEVRTALQPLLEDPVRAVRIAAAWALCATLDLNSRAGKELVLMLDHNADQPTGRMQLGQFASPDDVWLGLRGVRTTLVERSARHSPQPRAWARASAGTRTLGTTATGPRSDRAVSAATAPSTPNSPMPRTPTRV